MNGRWTWSLGTASLALVAACSGSNDNPFAPWDADTGEPEAGDTAELQDTGTGDTAADTGVPDTAPTDTGTDAATDTGAADVDAADGSDVGVDAEPFCGDGAVDDDEECDDGNLLDYDGCSADCTVEDCVPGSDTDGDGIDDCDDVEECDGIDNNGNGAVDEFPVDPEIGDPCYTGPEGTEGVGICTAGTLACRVGEVVCVGAVTPQFDELCNDLDDDCNGLVPVEEIEAGCSTDIVVTPSPFTARFEVITPPRAVDVAFNVDTTGSMGGVLEGLRADLRDVIAPAIRSVLPDAAFAVTTFEDFPFGEFGVATDLPFAVWQRVTTDIGRAQAALDGIELGNGNDTPESGLESLFQIATGSGVEWPAALGSPTVPPVPSGLAALGETVPDVDDFVVTLEAGQELRVDLFSDRVGGGLDTFVSVWDLDGTQLVSNDDSGDSLDSAVTLTAPVAGDYVVRVSSCCGGPPTWGGGSGWYLIAVAVDGVPLVPDAGTCSALERGEDTTAAGPTSTTGLPRLVAEVDRAPWDAGACADDCSALGEIEPEWVAAFCEDAGGDATCGDGLVSGREQCDDGNTDNGDGCSSACRAEFASVPPFDARTGFSTALGHGRIGGVGFRAGAVPVIVHATDTISHAATDYTEFDPRVGAHDGDAAFDALDAIGARVIGVASSTGALAELGTPDLRYLNYMVARTESRVPICAFDGTEERTGGTCGEGMCCTGLGGAGVAPDGDAQCPLVFRINGSGAGLSRAIAQGIEALANFRGDPVTARIVAPPGVPERAECLVSSIEVVDVVRPGDCLPELELADRDEDGLPETLLNATPSTRATFTFTAVNVDTRDWDGDGDVDEPCLDPGSYSLSFQLLDAADEVIYALRVSVTIPEL